MKIKHIDTWCEIKGNEAVSIAQVTYTNGNIRRWYDDTSRTWPKSATDFTESHDATRVNHQVTRYA